MVDPSAKKSFFSRGNSQSFLPTRDSWPLFSHQGNCTIFKDLLDHIGDELLLLDRQGRIVFANKAAARGLGCSKDVLLTKSIMEFWGQRLSVRDWQRKHFDVLKKKKQPSFSRVDRVNKKREPQAIEISAVYVAHRGQEYILSIGREVTQRIHIEQELKKAVEFYQLLFAEAGDPILIFDIIGRVTYANQAAEQAFKMPAAKIIGTHYKEFVQRHSLEKVNAVFAKVRQAATQLGVEVDTVNAKGEKIPFEVTFSPVEQNGKVVAVHSIGRDLRPRRQLENLFIKTEKMKAVQYMLVETAGELRNPLWGVLKKVEELVHKYHARDFEYIGYREFTDIMHALKNIRQQLKYCCQTSERMIELNQKRLRLKKSCCDANEVIGDVIRLKEEEFREKKVRHSLRLDSPLPKICLGNIDLNQVIQNLLNNALEAMPGGGIVSIRTAYVKKSGKVKIEIRDNGIGIPTENISHIYEPFFTTKQRGLEKNPGLGLTIVYSIVKACHGEMTVESNLRHGTTVTMYFPAKKRPS